MAAGIPDVRRHYGSAGQLVVEKIYREAEGLPVQIQKEGGLPTFVIDKVDRIPGQLVSRVVERFGYITCFLNGEEWRTVATTKSGSVYIKLQPSPLLTTRTYPN